MDDYTVQTSNEKTSELVTITPNGEKVPGGGLITNEVADKFFAIRGDNFTKAFEDIKTHHIKEEFDGEVLGKWILTEISYWNRDKERVVVLCGNSILVCKYDFVAMKASTIERIQLAKVTQAQKGQLQYPQNSVVTPRLYEGLRISWGTLEDRPWYHKWNPLSTDIPFTTFTSHPVLQLKDLESKELYDVNEFFSMLKQLLSDNTRIRFTENQPIIIESYVGIASYVHNQSRLGFSRERGGVSF